MNMGTDRHGWDKFWAKRKDRYLTTKQLRPFYNNFVCMMHIIDRCGKAKRPDNIFLNPSILEVGVGRGTMSGLFEKKGFYTFCSDIVNKLTYPASGHLFVENDILESKPFRDSQFDIVFTYGLLEHFKTQDKGTIIRRCLQMTKPGGLSMHYVVPKKWTNIAEDRSVYRDNCVDLLADGYVKSYTELCSKHGKKFVFPVWGNKSWECSKFMSKGFILWIKKYTSIDQYVSKNILEKKT